MTWKQSRQQFTVESNLKHFENIRFPKCNFINSSLLRQVICKGSRQHFHHKTTASGRCSFPSVYLFTKPSSLSPNRNSFGVFSALSARHVSMTDAPLFHRLRLLGLLHHDVCILANIQGENTKLLKPPMHSNTTTGDIFISVYNSNPHQARQRSAHYSRKTILCSLSHIYIYS